MTEENQKRRDHLAEVEQTARMYLANIDGDPVRYGMALDRGMERIAGIAYRYMLDHVDRTDAGQCQVCRKPLREAVIGRTGAAAAAMDNLELTNPAMCDDESYPGKTKEADMGGDACQCYKLTVEIQDNGIIRDPFGWIVGYCNSEWLQRMLNRPPYGLTVSEDGSLINWCGRNYVPQNDKEGK